MGKISKVDLANIVGQRLKELRKAKTDLGQKDVADEIGITKQALSSYESGRHLPDQAILIDLAKYYGCTTDYLYGLSEKMNPSSTDYSERNSVNYLLHALDLLAEDEGDFLADSITETLNSLSLNKGNPQRRNLIECLGQLFYSFAEYIEMSTSYGKHLSEKMSTNDLTADEIAVKLAYISGFDDIYNIIDDIRRAGIASVLTFSANAKKALRIRSGQRTGVKKSLKTIELEEKLTEMLEKED
jgi:transcriptional regulator with XRE-family HTH domain